MKWTLSTNAKISRYHAHSGKSMVSTFTVIVDGITLRILVIAKQPVMSKPSHSLQVLEKCKPSGTYFLPVL